MVLFAEGCAYRPAVNEHLVEQGGRMNDRIADEIVGVGIQVAGGTAGSRRQTSANVTRRRDASSHNT